MDTYGYPWFNLLISGSTIGRWRLRPDGVEPGALRAGQRRGAPGFNSSCWHRRSSPQLPRANPHRRIQTQVIQGGDITIRRMEPTGGDIKSQGGQVSPLVRAHRFWLQIAEVPQLEDSLVWSPSVGMWCLVRSGTRYDCHSGGWSKAPRLRTQLLLVACMRICYCQLFS